MFVVREKFLNELNSSVLILNFIAYLFGSGIVLTIVYDSPIDNLALKIIALFMPSFIAIAQIALLAIGYLNDTAMESCRLYMAEEAQDELMKLYPEANRRIEEFLMINGFVANSKSILPTYLQLFSNKFIRSTLIGLALITLRVMLGFVVIRLYVSIVLNSLVIDIVYIALNILGAFTSFLLIDSIPLLKS